MESEFLHSDAESQLSRLKSGLRWLFFENPEGDEQFRAEISYYLGRGLRLSTLLGFSFLIFYLGVGIFVMQRTVTLLQGVDNYMSILDKLVMLVILALAFFASYTRFGQQHARLILAVGVILAGLATITDDFLNQNTDFSTGWLALFLMLAVGTMPYRASQALVLGIAMWSVYPVVLLVGPGLFDQPPQHMERMQRIFMGIMVILSTGISGSLYLSRYRNFLSRRALHVANDRITEQAERLQEMDRIKARFFANLSHEFRTPLTLIQGPVEDALQGHSGPISHRLSEHLKIARRNGRRLRRLIDQLLDLSKLEAGKLELDEGVYDVVRFVRTLVSSFSSLAESKEVSLSFDSDRDSLAMAFDADKIEKVVTNLLSNAIKFTPEHGKVHVALKMIDVEGENQHLFQMSVKDTGPGIPKAEIDQVFDRFHQASQGPHSNVIQTGTGIGLALVKELVGLHGGDVSVESEIGFGSTFTISLPVKESKEFVSEPLQEIEPNHDDDYDVFEEEIDEVEAPAEDAPLILVADDNEDVRTYLRAHLASRYRVVEAKDGFEVLERLKEELPALVLSDVMMPGRDGHEVCHAIKSDPRTDHIPVVLMTARASSESRRDGLYAGADDYLFKPFNASDLMVRIENLIEIRRVLREHYSGEGEYVLEPSAVTVKSADAQFMERLQDVVEEHIGNSNFGVDWLASEVGISTRQLQRRIRGFLGLSAAGFIRTLRLKRAIQLLEAKAGTVSEIAYKVGFTDPNYFSRLFKQTFGSSPTEYVKENST